MEFSIKTNEIGMNDIITKNLKEEIIKAFEDIMGKDYSYIEMMTQKLKEFYSYKYKFKTGNWKIIKERREKNEN